MSQNLLDQVIDDVPVVAREQGDEAAGVVATVKGERSELKGSDPAFRALPKELDVFSGQVQSADIVEERVRLRAREAQVRCADLDELPTRSPSRERQVRICARAKHYMDARGQTVEQHRNAVLHRFAFDDMEVV